MIHVDHVPQVAMGTRNQRASMIHPHTRLVGDLLRRTLALVRTHPVRVGMTLHEVFNGQPLRVEGLYAKALQQACSLKQHEKVVDLHASLAHLEDIQQQLVLDRLELALVSMMAGFLD